MRSQGIGKQLLDFVKDKKSKLYLNVYQKNIRAVQFYQREDFEIDCESIDEDTRERDYEMIWKEILTKGPILKTLTKLAVPIMASSFLGTLYNITDMAWIGLLGSKAVAGVGVGGMFTWFSQGLASMSRMGGQVQVAQCIGRGDKEEAHKYAQTAVQLATLMGLLFAAVMLLFLHPLVGFFQLQDPEALQAALSYTKIACGLIVFSFLTLTLTGIYTAQGDSKTPFIANFIGLVTNMILDPLLILGLGPVNKFGVNGLLRKSRLQINIHVKRLLNKALLN